VSVYESEEGEDEGYAGGDFGEYEDGGGGVGGTGERFGG
jgi:hypothetical protein